MSERDYLWEEFREDRPGIEFPIEEHLSPQEQENIIKVLGRTFHQQHGGMFLGEARLNKWNPDDAQKIDSPRATKFGPAMIRRIKKIFGRY